jgi:hypothetical protein
MSKKSKEFETRQRLSLVSDLIPAQRLGALHGLLIAGALAMLIWGALILLLR